MAVTLIIGIFDGFEMKVFPNSDITSPVKSVVLCLHFKSIRCMWFNEWKAEVVEIINLLKCYF